MTVWSGDTITGTQPFVVDLRGVPNQGDIIMPVDYTNGDGWNLVGNPYPSTIDWDSPDWVKQNMANAVYILNPDTEQYATYINGASANGGSPLIASQQAFWVVATAASPVLTAKEGVKSPVDQAFFKAGGGISPGMHITLNGYNKSDECVIRHVQNASQAFDSEYDAYKKFANWEGYPHISLLNDSNVDLTVHSFDKSFQEWAIPLRAVVFESGDYDILFTDLGELDVPCIKLEDTYTGQVYPIEEGVPVNVFLSDTTWTPRFILHVGKNYEILTQSVVCHGEENGGFNIHLDNDDNGLNYTLFSQSGQIAGIVANAEIEIDSLMVGTYSLNIQGLNNLCQSENFMINITQPMPLQINSNLTHEVNGGDGQIEVNVTGGLGNYSYFWSNNMSQINIEQGSINSNVYPNLSAGTYALTVQDENGCTAEQVFDINNVLSINTESVTDNSPVRFAYNTTSKVIQLNGNIQGEWYLYSVSGQLIKVVVVSEQQTYSEIKIEDPLANGIYILQSAEKAFKFSY